MGNVFFLFETRKPIHVSCAVKTARTLESRMKIKKSSLKKRKIIVSKLWSIIGLFNMKCNKCDFVVVWFKYIEEKRFAGTIKKYIYFPHFVVLYST